MQTQIDFAEPGSAAGWDAYVDDRPDATFFHRRGWSAVLERTFAYRDHSLVATRGGEVRGVLPLLLVRNLPTGHSLVSTPFGVYGGIVADEEETARLLLDRARECGERLGVRYVELRQTTPIGDLPVKNLYVTFKRPIFPTSDENMAAIPRNQRRSIRLGFKNGLSSRVGDFDLFDPFYDVYSESVRNLGTPVFPKSLFENLLREFGPACRILGVFHEGRMVAGVMTFLFQDQVMPYYGGAVRDAFRLSANDFMYWSLMIHGMEHGFRVFDFGRSKVDSGSYHFKRHWGFEPTPLPYQFLLIRQRSIPDLSPRNPKFAAAIRLWQRIPLPVTQWIGPKIIRYFP
ncbi:MAG TPA: FemAB family XrtA/PEP-CTERM system-associated protein [Candidatus Eisenbacteria bacterium]